MTIVYSLMHFSLFTLYLILKKSTINAQISYTKYTKQYGLLITAYGGNYLKVLLKQIYITLNVIKQTYFIGIYKSVFLVKNGLNIINILYIASHKVFPLYYELCLESAGNLFSIVFHVWFPSSQFLMHFVMLIQFRDIIQFYSKIIEYFKIVRDNFQKWHRNGFQRS